jgi:quinol monooxygenase YgiN
VFVASIVCRVQPAKQREFLAAVARLMTETRRRSGCIDCRLAADPGDPASLTLIFVWSDRRAHESFNDSTEYGVLRGMRFLMTATPVVVVDEVIARDRQTSPQGWQS